MLEVLVPQQTMSSNTSISYGRHSVNARMPRNDTSSDHTIPRNDDILRTSEPIESTSISSSSSSSSPLMEQHTQLIVVGILIGMIVILSFIFVMLLFLLPCIRRPLQRRASTDKRKIAKRYQTVDAWLITKVCIIQYSTVQNRTVYCWNECY